MVHYHIQWPSKSRLDHLRFSTRRLAEVSAKLLGEPGEEFAIILAYDDTCERCKQAQPEPQPAGAPKLRRKAVA